MSSPEAIRWQNAALATLMTQEIMSKHLPNETAISRIRQLGMMNLLLTVYGDATRITINDVEQVTGIARNTVVATIEPLVARGLLVKTQAKASHGKGKEFVFHIPRDMLLKLLG